jgi:uncharacterized protein YaiL (DUF2058 family)
MQNLRDKLLKAGLVNEQQVKEAQKKAEARPVPRTPQRPPPQRPGPGAGQGSRTLSLDEQQSREAFAARDAEQEVSRRKEAEKQAEARMQSARARTIRAIVATNRITEPGATAFHWVRRNGKIGRILVSEATAARLEAGSAAVVEDPGQPDPAVIPSGAAREVYGIDPKAIRFWAGPDKPIGFEESEPGDAPEDAAARAAE